MKERYRKTFEQLHLSPDRAAEVRSRLQGASSPKEVISMRQRTLRVILVAAAVIVALSLSAFAYAHWSGFAFTAGMSAGERAAIEQEASIGRVGEEVDADGTVTYPDGRVLSAEEAAEYEREQIETKKQTVRESTDLVDVDTMTLVPNGITEVETGEDGTFADFALGNGYAVVLHPEGQNSYQLKAGASVTITLRTDEACYLEFGMAKDGKVVEAETLHAENHTETFTIPEDGNYCFTLMYCSASMDFFTDGSLTIQ